MKTNTQKLNEKNIPLGARQKMPFWYSLAWSTRIISLSINTILLSFVTYYCTDMLGLNPGIVAGMLVGSKIIDAITDVGAGYLVERTHTKWGKGRPYELFIILTWVFTIMMFSVPEIGDTGKYVYVFIMYVLVNAICVTMLGAVDSVYMARAFTTDNNRMKALSVQGFVVMFISILFNIFFPILMSTLGTTKTGWTTLALIIGVPAGLIGILRFLLVKEIVEDKPESENISVTEEKNNTTKDKSLIQMFQLLLQNKFFFIVVGMMFLINIINNLNTANTYYFKYIMGDVGLMSIVGMTGMATPFLLFFFPVLARKIGTTKLLRIGGILGVAGIAIRTIGGTNIATLFVGSLLSGIAVMPISMMINTYLIDCMDYGEWKTGTRIEGLVASVNNFAGKLGSAAASGFVGLIMGMAGYNGTLEVQSAAANNAIIGVYNFFPLILFMVFTFLTFMYNMDKVRPQMKADLEARKEK